MTIRIENVLAAPRAGVDRPTDAGRRELLRLGLIAAAGLLLPPRLLRGQEDKKKRAVGL